jgi:hypothetical protein
MEVLNAYNNLYYRLELTDVSSNKKLDFREPLLSSDLNLLTKLEDKSSLEGPLLKACLNFLDYSNSFHTEVQRSNFALDRTSLALRNFL